MKELYEELQDRMKQLESRKQTDITQGRISELQFIIAKIQQFLLTQNK